MLVLDGESSDEEDESSAEEAETDEEPAEVGSAGLDTRVCALCHVRGDKTDQGRLLPTAPDTWVHTNWVHTRLSGYYGIRRGDGFHQLNLGGGFRACCGHREALAAASQGCCGQQRTRCPGRLIGGVRPRGEVSKYFVHQSAKVLPHDVKYFISPDCR
jgi:hypothetical protein